MNNGNLERPKGAIIKKLTLFGKRGMSQQDIDDRAPAVIMVDSDMTAELKFGAVAGRMEYKDNVDKTERYLDFRGDKLIRLRIGDLEIPCWIHYVRETYSYPHMPKQDSEATAKTIIGIQQDYRNLANANKFRDKDLITHYLKLAGIGLLALVGLWVAIPFVIDTLGVNVDLPCAIWDSAKCVVEEVVQQNSTGIVIQ